jgi:hypothetical protein
MAWPDGWTWQIPIAVRATAIDATLSNWTTILTEATLPDHVFDYALNGGGDLRFYGGKNGTNRLACDVRIFDTVNGIADIAVLIPTVSSSVDTVIYLRYGKAGAAQPAADAPYGQYASYDEHTVGVWPLTENPAGTAPQMRDRTANGNYGTTYGSMTSGQSVAGQVGKALIFDGIDDCVKLPEAVAVALPLTISCLVSLPFSPRGILFCLHRLYSSGTWVNLQFLSGKIAASVRNASNTGFFSIIDGAETYATGFHHVVFTADGIGTALHVDNRVAVGAKTLSSVPANSLPTHIGAFREGNSHANCTIDEVRIHSQNRSAAWIVAENKNLMQPATILEIGTPIAGNRRRRLLLACGG